MNRLSLWIALAGLLVGSSAMAYERAALIRLEGPVTPMMQAFMERKLDTARDRGADLVILEIDSPGGYLHTTYEMIDVLRDLPWARTVAYIPDEAISGAAIVALACDEIVMAPRARLGDAGPIVAGEDGLFRHAEQKVLSELAAHLRDLAESKGRSPALVEAMADRNLVVYQVTNRETGEVRYWSQAELDSASDAEQWERGKPVFETREDKFLTVTGERAVELGLAAETVDSQTELVDRYDLTEPIIELRPGAVDTTVYILNRPIVTGILFVIGLIALFAELSAPGISVGGLISGLCFALFFWSRFLGGTSTWLEVTLFLVGLVFLALEFFVIPGFGIAGLSGIALMLVSVLMASQDFVIPSTGRELETLGRSAGVVVVSGVVVLVAGVMMTRWLGEIPLLGRLALRPPSDPGQDASMLDKGDKPMAAAAHPLVAVGDWGEAHSPLRPAGRAKFGDHYLDVVADGSYVSAGQQIRVIAIEGNRVVVQPIE
ncbi:MAG: NfeD family protein [Pirellulaceae bacterium]